MMIKKTLSLNIKSDVKVYYIICDSTFIADTAIDFFAEMLREKGETEIEFLDSKSSLVEGFHIANSPSFFSSCKLVVARNPENVKSKDITQLSSLAKSPEFTSSDNYLIIIDNKQDIKFTGDSIKTIVFKKFKEDSVINILMDYALSLGVNLNRKQAGYITAIGNIELDYCINEVNKIALYYAGTPIIDDELKLLINPSIEKSVFNLIDDMADGDDWKCINKLDYITFNEPKVGNVINPIATNFRILFLMKLSKLAINDYVKLLFKQDWQIKNLLKQSESYSQVELITICNKILAYEYELKSGNMSDVSALNNIIISVLSRRFVKK